MVRFEHMFLLVLVILQV